MTSLILWWRHKQEKDYNKLFFYLLHLLLMSFKKDLVVHCQLTFKLLNGFTSSAI